MVFSLFYWNINSDIQIKKSFLLKLGTENDLAELQMRTGNLSIEIKSKAEIKFFLAVFAIFFVFIQFVINICLLIYWNLGVGFPQF